MRRKCIRRTFVFAVAAAMPFLILSPANGGAYSIQHVGLTDLPGVHDPAYLFSDVAVLTNTGEAAGTLSDTRYFRGMQEAWVYSPDTDQTSVIGFVDGVHILNGDVYNEIKQSNAAGEVAGIAYRFDATFDEQNGQDAWAYSPVTRSTQLIGLNDPAHTRGPDSYSFNTVSAMNEAGMIVGLANNASRNLYTGDAWIFSPSTNTTAPIGLAGTGIASVNGNATDAIVSLNNAGQVAGMTYSAGTAGSTLAWQYASNTGLTELIGLVDTAHTAATGATNNSILTMNPNGQVLGLASRFSGTTNAGVDAWIHSPTSHSTTVIGLVDSAHTRTDGFRINTPTGMNDSGQAVGAAERYSGTTDQGQDAWYYSPSAHTSRIIGLTDASHVSGTGVAMHAADLFNNTGMVVGTSLNYSTGVNDLWVFSSITNQTLPIGLTAADHPGGGSGFYSNNVPQYLTDSGWAAGAAQYINSSTQVAILTSVWVYSPTDQTTRLAGLYDARHSRANGVTRGNQIDYVNESGVVAGDAPLYDSQVNPSDAWIYDPMTHQTDFIPNTQGSVVEYLGEDGTAVGYYVTLDSTDVPVFTAFRWTDASGFQDLGVLVADELSTDGWQSLARGEVANSNGQLAGQGLGTTGAELAYLLTPTTVPEPVSFATVIAISPVLLMRRRPVSATWSATASKSCA